MRACQGSPQFDKCNRPISTSESQRHNEYAAWHTNSVSVEENVIHYTPALPEQVFRQEQATQATIAPNKSLENRRTTQSYQVTNSFSAVKDEHADLAEIRAVETSSPVKTDSICPIVPNFVESKGQKYKLMQLTDFIRLRNFAENQDGKWTLVHEDMQKALLVESRPEDLKPGERGTGFNIVRTTVEWNDINPETLFNTLHDADYRATWDKKMVDGYNICQLDPRNDIGYYSVNPHWMISKRDFCNMRSWMEFSNGEYIIMNHSVDHADCPEREGFVRARSILTGYYMVPTSSGGTKLIFISHSDPKGNIPAWLINKLMGSLIPNTISNLHDVALKYVSWAVEKYGTDIKNNWRTPKIDWDGSTKEALDNAALTKIDDLPTATTVSI